MLPSPAQCRAARALLDWTQKDLAEASKVGMKTIADYERGASTPYERTVRDLREAFKAAGIEFTNGTAPGLQLKPRKRGKGK
ncbi:MAG: hypothetical protein QOF14_1268 [Hyphomicrobiales bacterium]|jgi:transcriptional regulator with XRE-family HTH domain|nr:hypothetical protein [Hyphomicrobiales bacterium]